MNNDSITIKYELERIQKLVSVCNEEIVYWKHQKELLEQKQFEYELGKKLLS
jgi:hypothetical protein